jgi:hypothetical protein
LFLGEKDLPGNVTALVRLAVEKNPEVKRELEASGCLPERLITVPDKRYKVGVRDTPEKLVSRTNAALWQAEKGVTDETIKALRDFAGTAVIDDPAQLMKFLQTQFDVLPQPQFVPGGKFSAVWVQPHELLDKLFSNPLIVDHLRLAPPFDRSGPLIWCWVAVRYLHDRILIACQGDGTMEHGKNGRSFFHEEMWVVALLKMNARGEMVMMSFSERCAVMRQPWSGMPLKCFSFSYDLCMF